MTECVNHQIYIITTFLPTEAFSLTPRTYPYVATERGEALVFSYQYHTNLEASLDNKENTSTGFSIKLSDKM